MGGRRRGCVIIFMMCWVSFAAERWDGRVLMEVLMLCDVGSSEQVVAGM